MRVYVLIFCSIYLLACQTKKTKENESNIGDLPNIVILLADDLGYGDLGCYGGAAKTPNLDKLASDGIRMTNFYSAAPNCSPARVGLLTGLFPSKAGMYNYMPQGHPMHLKSELVTIAEIVKTNGYSTAHFGKWHVSNLRPDADLSQAQPIDQGFDYSLGTTNNAQPSHLNPINFVRNGTKVGEMKGYSCQIVVDEAIDWLNKDKAKEKPFLMYMAFHEPHKKVASPPNLTAKYTGHSMRDAEYLANVENMDLAIGRLIQAMEEMGLNENTLILFASDNGSYRNGSNGDLLGGKSFVYEGGIRVPGIFYWKDVIKPGQTNHELASLVDIMPSICELTRAIHPKRDQLDGVSLYPLFCGQALNREKPLSWFFYRSSPQIAMRFGNYTLLGNSQDSIRLTHPTTRPDMDYIKGLTLDSFEMYNLETDLSQSNPLNLNSLPKAAFYIKQLKSRLNELQELGPYWDELPPDTRTKKLRTEWRELRPTGFSN